MKEIKIMLPSIGDVKKFNMIVTRYTGDVDLVSGRYVIDAKSIMGIFSLDLGKEINVQIHGHAPEKLAEELKEFCVK